MGSATWVLVVLAAVLIVVALVVFVAPLARGGAGAGGRPGAEQGTAPSATGSLARGFGYLHVSPRSPLRRGGVHQRLARAFARIDAVDPHAAPRRIGEALAQARPAAPGEPR